LFSRAEPLLDRVLQGMRASPHPPSPERGTRCKTHLSTYGTVYL
jgi:hypothetical protein